MVLDKPVEKQEQVNPARPAGGGEPPEPPQIKVPMEIPKRKKGQEVQLDRPDAGQSWLRESVVFPKKYSTIQRCSVMAPISISIHAKIESSLKFPVLIQSCNFSVMAPFVPYGYGPPPHHHTQA